MNATNISAVVDGWSVVRIHLCLPVDFLKKVDDGAKDRYISRSDFIRLALMEKLDAKSMFADDEFDEMLKREFGDNGDDKDD